MSFLVDTNVLSEFAKDHPDDNVFKWALSNEANLYVSSFTLGELKYGVAILPEGKRKQVLQAWLTRTYEILEGRILSFDRIVADTWAEVRASLRKEGRVLPTIDSIIAAIAIRHDLTIATRNVRDFDGMSVPVVNPFEAL